MCSERREPGFIHAGRAAGRDVFTTFEVIPNPTTDTKNHGPVSFDHIGANEDYPEASEERRREIVADHKRYQRGCSGFRLTTTACPGMREVKKPIGMGTSMLDSHNVRRDATPAGNAPNEGVIEVDPQRPCHIGCSSVLVIH